MDALVPTTSAEILLISLLVEVLPVSTILLKGWKVRSRVDQQIRVYPRSKDRVLQEEQYRSVVKP